ncbi:MAG: 3-deoxy-manno-octulosonate cytidylyltransferase [Marinifilaceae bacterium]
MNFIGIIPARYASTRFPGKPLVEISGKIMIQRVCDQVSKILDTVYVATDDKRIFDAVKSFGGKVVMTSTEHKSGTDRVNEAYSKIVELEGKSFDVIINVQGDEPFIQAEQIESLMSCFTSLSVDIATLVKKIDDKDELFDINKVKVVRAINGKALYFSRHTIPFLRDTEKSLWLEKQTFFKHIGMYAYRSNVLQQIANMPMGMLEKSESLEQLRWLENGLNIQTAITDIESIGIDTPEDLERVKNLKF